ncbi:MAG: MerR family transcriptional regulator [Proteobacteria bacterium]|nr:MAG: MerR family transcriptional regulator [Pseudomonadota bacterium]
MQIGEFSKKVGLTQDTVRYYEKIGFFSKRRSTNGYRTYGDSDLKDAEFIACGKSMGFTLKETLDIAREWEGGKLSPKPARIESLMSKIKQVEAEIARLRKIKKTVSLKLKAFDLENEIC